MRTEIIKIKSDAKPHKDCIRNKRTIIDKKDGIIEIQFHWIFLLVAGMLLFLFIISIIFAQGGRADEKISMEVLRQLTASFKGKSQISNSYTEMEIPNTKIYFDCNPSDLVFNYRLENSQRDILPIEIIFTNRELGARKIQLYTLDFQIPFTVTRFVYLTTPSNAFIIYNTSANPDAKALFDALPPNVTKFYASQSNTLAKLKSDFPKHKVICFYLDCPTTPPYIMIRKSSTNLFGNGEVIYYTSASQRKVNYTALPSLIGAVYTDSPDVYECQMKRAFKQFELKRKLHLTRISKLESALTASNPCFAMLANPKNTLEDMENKSHNPSGQSILELSRDLEDENYDLDVKGCPLIY